MQKVTDVKFPECLNSTVNNQSRQILEPDTENIKISSHSPHISLLDGNY